MNNTLINHFASSMYNNFFQTTPKTSIKITRCSDYFVIILEYKQLGKMQITTTFEDLVNIHKVVLTKLTDKNITALRAVISILSSIMSREELITELRRQNDGTRMVTLIQMDNIIHKIGVAPMLLLWTLETYSI